GLFLEQRPHAIGIRLHEPAGVTARRAAARCAPVAPRPAPPERREELIAQPNDGSAEKLVSTRKGLHGLSKPLELAPQAHQSSHRRCSKPQRAQVRLCRAAGISLPTCTPFTVWIIVTVK